MVDNFEKRQHNYTASLLDIRLYLTPLGQAWQFIETCGAKNPLC
jgi:hypothetical protein